MKKRTIPTRNIGLGPQIHRSWIRVIGGTCVIVLLALTVMGCGERMESMERQQARLSNQLGVVQVELGEYDRAIDTLNNAIRLEPGDPSEYFLRGVALWNMGEYQRAMADYTEAIRLARPNQLPPTNERGVVHYYRALLFDDMGDYEHAVADYTEAIRLSPQFAPAYRHRGDTYYRTNRLDLALKDYEAASPLYDQWLIEAPQCACSWGEKADFLATCPEQSLRNGAEAVADAQKANELQPIHYRVPEWVDTLAAAYAEKGDFGQAVQWEQKAISLVPASSAIARKYAARLKLYQQGKPYRSNM